MASGDQFNTANGLDTPAVHRNVAPGITCDVWGNPARPTIELWRIAGMGHVYPADNATVAAAPSIARFWGLLA